MWEWTEVDEGVFGVGGLDAEAIRDAQICEQRRIAQLRLNPLVSFLEISQSVVMD